MSTISPLIDTLLHHVLGRRGELERHALPPRGPMVVSGTSEVQGQLRGEPEGGGPASSNAPSQRVGHGGGPGESRADADGDAADRSLSPRGERESLSREARVIAQVLGRFPQPASVMLLPGVSRGHASVAAPARLSAETELIDGLEGSRLRPAMRLDAGTLASSLRDGVVESGLFYERHLALALMDKWPLTRLAHEPQAKVAAEFGPAVEDDIAPIVRHQLELLGGEPLRLQFPLHAGVIASLEILLGEEDGEVGPEGDEDGEGGGQSPESPSWRTRITVDLPALGRVDARIGGYSDGLRIELHGASEVACAALTDGGKALEAGLGGQGLALSALSVEALDANAGEAGS
ncbi:flagellar hook-length control protein FliK [Halotalea alkalilenta]|uniref:flagellar hook-length control protein FliK n=1 Tax=Halotalea alkalilenta TaxID=376489 RepID=UPI00048585B6|nr:flagellar hook-length control protein FliK [Halotalea alkalilenta]